jgi:hypothetical protein
MSRFEPTLLKREVAMITFQAQHVEDRQWVNVYAQVESVKVSQNGNILAFSALSHTGEDGEPHFIPYVLSHDRSHSHKDAIHQAINAVLVAGSTARGYVKGANSLEAFKMGPGRGMVVQGLKGARGGFLWGVGAMLLKEIVGHILVSDNSPHYYVSPYGPDLHAPVRYPGQR